MKDSVGDSPLIKVRVDNAILILLTELQSLSQFPVEGLGVGCKHSNLLRFVHDVELAISEEKEVNLRGAQSIDGLDELVITHFYHWVSAKNFYCAI